CERPKGGTVSVSRGDGVGRLADLPGDGRLAGDAPSGGLAGGFALGGPAGDLAAGFLAAAEPEPDPGPAGGPLAVVAVEVGYRPLPGAAQIRAVDQKAVPFAAPHGQNEP